MKRFLTPLLLIALLAAIVAGCNNPGKILATGLRVELTGVGRNSEGEATASWRVVNTNISAYLLSRVTTKIYLNGTYLGQTLDTEPMAVPANNAAERTSRLKDGDAAGRVLAEAAASGTAGYRIEAHLVVLIYGETTEKVVLANTGTVPVAAK